MALLQFQNKNQIMNNYALNSTIIILLILTGCSKYPDLRVGYKFDYDGKYTLVIVDSNNNILINETILDFAFDSSFIIAAQRPWDSIPDIKSMNYIESNKAFERSTFRQYWIINKKEKTDDSLNVLTKHARYSNVYGPFNKKNYLKKREVLKIPKSLMLKDD
jgi:hypothetical protein